MLCKLLDSEINAGLQTFAFNIFRVWIGDEMNGRAAMARSRRRTRPGLTMPPSPIGCTRQRSGSMPTAPMPSVISSAFNRDRSKRRSAAVDLKAKNRG